MEKNHNNTAVRAKMNVCPKKIHVQKSVHVCMVCYNVCVIDADSGLWGFVRTVIDMMMQFVFVGAIISPQPPSISSSSLSGISREKVKLTNDASR